jgi:hypothetical protein
MCACKAKYSGNGFDCKDATPPTLAFTVSTRTVSVIAAVGAFSATVTFLPIMAANDNLTPQASIDTYCQGLIDGAWVDVRSGVTPLPAGTTVVACWARDLDGLQSAPVSFAIVVACAQGFTAMPGQGCQGEKSRRDIGWFGVRRSRAELGNGCWG